MEEKHISEQEGLRLITEMIHRAKANIHERGTSAILWGAVTAVAGLTDFFENYFHFYIGFDIWIIILVAILPQIIISIREGKNRKVITHEEKAIDAIWIVYAISVACYLFFMNVVPGQAAKEFAAVHGVVDRNFPGYIFSVSSIWLILYAIPTLATGLISRFRPMLVSGLLCYALFFLSCYTDDTWDLLLLGIAGIINWLIPGLLLRGRYLKARAAHV